MSESTESIETLCPVCSKPYDGIFCTACTTAPSEKGSFGEGLDNSDSTAEKPATAYLVDLVSNRKIPVSVPRCKAGRDDLNDIVITGDQSISRFHFVLTRENAQYFVQDNKSRHGTFLNGNQITGVEAINDGDVLKVGVSLFWFVIEVPLVAQQGAEPMPVDMTERPSGLPVLNAKDLPMQGELRMSKSSQRSGRQPDPALTATSDSIPALNPDSTLAEYLGIKPSHTNKFVGTSHEAQEKTIPPSHMDSTFVSPPPSSARSGSESSNPTQELDLSSVPEETEHVQTNSDELEKISKKYTESE